MYKLLFCFLWFIRHIYILNNILILDINKENEELYKSDEDFIIQDPILKHKKINDESIMYYM